MPFNSLSYLCFLPVVLLLVSLTRGRSCWPVLLASSIFFYAALNIPYLLLVLLLVTSFTFLAGLAIDRSKTDRGRQALLGAGIAVNVGILMFLKYFPLIWGTLNGLLHFVSPQISAPQAPVLATVGASYYIFQAISYLVDVYLETEPVERHFGYFALYLSFFPKLLQGPIERSGALLQQLKKPYHFEYENARAGLLLFAWGLWKKLVIADRLAPLVGTAYGDPHAYAGLSLVLATYCYALQIYCDFSGYTDMARGTALLFNIELTENFNAPYLATSMAEFWRRWHISFSRWILDYIFKPLQMLWRSAGSIGTAAALLVTFVVSGMWHGASWGFVVWGALHGLFMAASVLYKPYQKKLHGLLGLGTGKGRGRGMGRVVTIWQTMATFHLVAFAWIFFRANSLADAYFISLSLPAILAGDFGLPQMAKLINIFGRNDALIAIAATLVMLAVGYLRGKIQLFDSPIYLRWSCYLALVSMILLLSSFHGSSEFIYLQF